MAMRSKARAKVGKKAVKKPVKKTAKNAVKKATKKAVKKSVKKTTPKSTAPSLPARTAGIGDEAVLKATGKRWSEWLALLDKAGATKWTHRRIALYLHEQLAVAEWWCQMVAVGYEQARGLREKHQTATGYNAHSSKTFALPIAEMYDRWADEKKRRRWLDARGYFIRKANENKSLRITWDDGSSVEVDFWAKGPARTLVQVQQSKLPDAPAVDRAKAFWKLQFAALERGI